MQVIISKNKYIQLIDDLRDNYNNLDENGCFFAIFSTEYDKNGNVEHDFFEIIHEAVEIGYTYINTIVYPTKEVQKVFFDDNVRYVVWLCKDVKQMKFNKDHIREKHIWKDVEWGKRAKNYNPKGKDPGNVWIPTEDDGHANITKHILLSDDEVIARIVAMTECGNNYSVLNGKHRIITVIDRKEKHFEQDNSDERVEGRVVFGTSENMNKIQDGTVSVAVTSPPYWDLKDYFKKGQIGQEPYDEYIARMGKVWKQCFNKLKNDGVLWIDINIRQQKGKVILIPYDIVKQCKDIGYTYKGILIWHKSSGIPTGDKNIVDRHEYVLVFAKDENSLIDITAYNNIEDYKNTDINGGAFWNINRKAGSVGKKFIHPAIYPNGLVSRIVCINSKPGDTILDPFLGSGTSLIASIQNNRNFVGYEFNEGFKELMESRFSSELNSTDIIRYEN